MFEFTPSNITGRGRGRQRGRPGSVEDRVAEGHPSAPGGLGPPTSPASGVGRHTTWGLVGALRLGLGLGNATIPGKGLGVTWGLVGAFYIQKKK